MTGEPSGILGWFGHTNSLTVGGHSGTVEPMGYCIEQIGGDFRLPRKNYDDALAALRQIMTRTDLMSGGDGRTKKWFAFCNDVNPARWHTLADALRDFCFDSVEDETGIIAIEFWGEKLGDERAILGCVAPFVEPDSTIVFRGEDGARWTWVFQPDGIVELL